MNIVCDPSKASINGSANDPVGFSAVGSTNKWGKRQRNYYGTSYVDKDLGGVNDSEEEEMLQLEEEDATARQRKIESANSLVDYDKLMDYSVENDNEKCQLFEVLHISHAKNISEEVCDGNQNNSQETALEGIAKQNVPILPLEKANDVNFDGERNCIPTENRRKISYEIRKNKGTRKDKGRRKEKQRHSRVMKRSQYEKALIKRKSQVPNMRREIGRYDGEKRGIRVSTIRSIKF